jgi:hypothetical protein
MLDGYTRSTRYQKLRDGPVGRFPPTPKYLAMHEFETTVSPPNTRLVVGTEWAKKVLGSAQAASSQKWELISEYSKSGVTGEAF